MRLAIRLLQLLSFCMVALAGGAAAALDPTLDIAQYKHTSWTAEDGVPASITALDQGRDGYLWIGGRDGLFRFDGVRFEFISAPASARKLPAVSAVFGARDGGVWVGYAAGGVSVYRDGALHSAAMPNPEGYVMAIRQAGDGAIWVMLGRPDLPLVRWYRGKWEEIGSNRGLPAGFLISLLAARNGDIWVSSLDRVYVLRKGATRFRPTGKTDGHGALSEDGSGHVWLSDAGGSRAISGALAVPEAGRASRYFTPPFPRAARVLFDADGNLWGFNGRDGVFRLASPRPNGPRSAAAAAAEFQSYDAADGLTSDAAGAMVEDLEGDIWVGGMLGLDRFRRSAVVTEPLLRRLPKWGQVLFAASDGTVYIGQGGSLYRVRPRGKPEPLLENIPDPAAICEGPDKSVWIILDNRAIRLRAQERTTVAMPPIGYVAGVQDCAVDERNTLWISAVADGLFAHHAGGWRQVRTSQMEDGGPTNLTADRAGGMYLYSQTNSLFHIDNGVLTDAAPGPRPSIDDLNVLFQGRRDLLMAGAFGLARLRQGRLAFISRERVPAFFDPTGLVQTPAGDTWLLSRAGIVRLSTAALDRAFEDPRQALSPTIFDIRDGLPGAPTGGMRDAVLGGDGRLWFATTGGVSWLEPARLRRNTRPPPVFVSALTAAGRVHRDPTVVHLPAGTSSVEIDYVALSLAIPERVTFRYRLEGQREGWIDPGLRRQAFFTNLGPGTYRFRVIAANHDGVWNREGATLEFTIPPTFIQSVWFRLIVFVLFAGVLWLIYRMRVQQVTARVRSELEVRLAERERIARELHDTLLQGFQGLVLRFQAVADRLPRNRSVRPLLDEALDKAEAVLVEGRDRVRDLRAADESGELAEALIDAASELAADAPARFDFTVEGAPRDLHRLVREEVKRIGEEAIRNAFQHAHASRIEAVLTWRPDELSLNVQDNGIGLPREVATAGARSGHYGLTGMRERAESIGGTLSVTSREGAGTEVRLSIPAAAAYVGGREARWSLFLRSLGLKG